MLDFWATLEVVLTLSARILIFNTQTHKNRTTSELLQAFLTIINYHYCLIISPQAASDSFATAWVVTH